VSRPGAEQWPATDEVALAEVMAALGRRGRRDQPLGPLTTYRVGGPAAVLVEVEDEDDLRAVRGALAGRAVPVLVIGRGSNLLVADAGFRGVAVHLGRGFSGIDLPEDRGSGMTVVRAGAAIQLPVLARQCVEAGLTGFEWAAGVPGSLGGAVRMNAGGHGSDMAASVVRYRSIDLGTETEGDYDADRLAYAYRSSSIRSTEVVVWAEMALAAGDPEVGRATISEIVRWRRQHQPGGSNAGSVFTNPPGDSAGRLVEAAGLKGLRRGTARVSEKHANFIQADPGGSADDVWGLMDYVRQEVARQFGIDLRPEVHLAGFATRHTGAAGDTPAPVGEIDR